MGTNLSYKEGENGKYGYVRADGSWLFEPQFDSVNRFKEGLAKPSFIDGNRVVDECGFILVELP